jgi:hypothetical protein
MPPPIDPGLDGKQILLAISDGEFRRDRSVNFFLSQ